MSDLLDPLLEAVGDGAPLCERCGIRPIRPYSGRGKRPVTCEECLPATTKQTRARQEKAPRSLNIKLGAPSAPTSKGKQDAAKVEEAAKRMATVVSAALFMAGAQNDGLTIAAHQEQWAKAVGGLAPYEPWLVKLCDGGAGMSGRTLAWTAATMASLTMLLPILLAHNLIPEGKIRAAIGQVMSLAEQQAASPPPADPAPADA